MSKIKTYKGFDGNLQCRGFQYKVGETYATYDVKPETVGQFTGLHDKNGKEIYEGDLVSYIVATGGIEELGIKSKTCFVVQYNDKKAAFEFGFTNGMNEAYNLFNGCLQHHKLVVVGNIHDNPELLKG